MAQIKTALPQARPKMTFKQWLCKDSTAGVICSLPFIIGLTMFLVVPMLLSAYYAFCDYNILSPAEWTGRCWQW